MATRTNAEVCREYYAKNRERLLAAAREKRASNIEAAREYQRAKYAEHREKNIEKAREYRRKNREAVNAKAMDKYQANRAVINERRKGYRAKHYTKIYERIQEWRKRNPEREAIYHAKRVLSEQTGVAVRDIPDEIAAAKCEQLKITRWVREQFSASAIEARRAATENTGAVHESAAREAGDAQ